ncbi:MAG: hypothetical protein H6Q16_1096 [Bacteroidetes bacterium]|nr:hypothetical protein [Bacteroidota bacterium]
MKKFILLICSIILLQSCVVNKQDIYGTYAIREYSWLTRFDINEDGTFFCLEGGGSVLQETYGTWIFSKNNRKIILKGYIQDLNNIPMIVTTKEHNYNGTIIVFNKPMMSIEESYPLFNKKEQLTSRDSVHYTIVLNDTLKYNINNDSLYIPNLIEVKDFYFKMYLCYDGYLTQPLQDTALTVKYQVKENDNNLFEIDFDFPKPKYGRIFFNEKINDTLSLRRNSIYWKRDKIKIKKSSNKK